MKYNQKLLKSTLLTICIGLFTFGCGDDDQEDIITDQPPEIESQSFTTSESVDDETVIGTVTATDPEGDELIFSITENSGELFEVTEAGKLTLTDGQQLDFETEEVHQLTVEVSDGADVASAEVIINVVDENENVAPAITDQVFEVGEDITDTDEIGTVEASDTNGDVLTFSITEDADDLFEITEAGVLSLQSGKVLDYGAKDAHTITVQVTDNIASTEAIITIDVLDVNEAPTMADQTFEVAEIISDTYEIGTIEASDSDGDALTFSITESAGDLFEITEAGVLSLQAGKSLDFESATVHQLTVEVSDGTESATATVTVNVTEVNETPFITVWAVDASGTIALPLYASTENTVTDYDFTVDWGDGVISEVTSYDDPDAEHTYSEAGEYSVTISGTIEGFNFYLNNYESASKIKDVSQWGGLKLGNDGGVFKNCSNLETFSAEDVPDFSGITDLSYMFSYATSFNGDISDWDVSNITNMSYMFHYAESFNQDIGDWDVSNVTNTKSMFYLANSFNQPIGNWDVSNVTNMGYMLAGTHAFNQPIGDWDVSNVTDMVCMLCGTSVFNQPIGDWDVSNVTDMGSMFFNALSFNQDIGDWDVSNVTMMYSMFQDAWEFNGNIKNWDVSNVTNMNSMFYGANAFNQDISGWDVSNVTMMFRMFSHALVFNQEIGSWDVSNITDMNHFFDNARAFNGDISDWDVSTVTNMYKMFYNAWSFNQDISSWDVSNVTDIGYMFNDGRAFDQDLSGWDTSNVMECTGFDNDSPIEDTDKLPTSGCFE